MAMNFGVDILPSVTGSSEGGRWLGSSSKKWKIYAYSITADTLSGNGSSITNLSANNVSAGTLSVQRGGTGMETASTVNAVVIGNATTANGNLRTISTASGAFYATATNGAPQFGTLPIGQGGTGVSNNAAVNKVFAGPSSGNAAAPSWRDLVVADLPGSIPNNKLANSTVKIGTQTISLGGTFDSNTIVKDLGLGTVLFYKGMKTSAPTAQTGDVAGDVYVVSGSAGGNDDGVWVYSSTNGWQKITTSASYKIMQNAVSDPSASGTSTTFISTISQSTNGEINVSKASLPIATSSVQGIAKFSTGLTVNSGTVTVDYGVVANIQELGSTASAGSTDAAARADHVHLLPHKSYQQTIATTDWTQAAEGDPWVYTVSDSFVTNNPSVDVNATVIDGQNSILSTLTVDTDTAGYVTYSIDVKPTNTIILKISLDKCR